MYKDAILFFLGIFILLPFLASGFGSFLIGVSLVQPWRDYGTLIGRILCFFKIIGLGIIIYSFLQFFGLLIFDLFSYGIIKVFLSEPKLEYIDTLQDTISSFLIFAPLIIGILSGFIASITNSYNIDLF